MDLNAWNINDNDWPLNGGDKQKLHFLLRYAILAPSGHNTQPWLFKISGNTLELHADRTRCLPVVDPEDRELVISCGCALYFLSAAARRFDCGLEIHKFPNPSSPDLLAQINILPAEPASKNDLSMFSAILQRHTNREAFETRSPPQEILDQLIDVAKEENTWLQILSEEDTRETIADLIAEGDRIQASDKLFRRELSSWVHSNRSRYSDGMPGYAFGIGDFASNLGPFILRTFDWGNGQAVKDRQLALGSPVLGILATKTDAPKSWLNTGQALAKLLLHLTKEGMSASFLNQPIETENLRNQVQDLLSAHGYPQILLRIGYGPKVKPTPRRGIDEVLIDDENG